MKKLVITICIATIGLLAGCTTSNEQTINIIKTISSTNIQQIKIDAKSTNIELSPSKQTEIQAELKGQVTNRVVNLNIQSSQEIVTIVENEKYEGSDTKAELTLHIKIPEKLYQKLAIKNEAGNIKLQKNLQVNNLEIHSKYGDITVNSLKSLPKNPTNVSINNDRGQVTLDLTEPIIGNHNIQISSGNLYLQVGQKPTPIDVDFQVQAGNIHPDFPLKGSASNSMNGHIGTKNESKNQLKAKVLSGNIHLKK
ncbi:DUF4097 family beta strand repeat-containing protein [Shimazuella kribbensis]|uniref:DUF4097 family beta strand repeat-containing protein n=1 Tax=Shimazuella kribbensis TaxID=139808 RepID=UPI0004274585|nr:DUF4097 family beta strand repeat-containing protein [Shimazuella kribbensis]